jgi:hypothetical protein
MEDNTKLIESLLERTAEYGKASFELVKLKALDKTSDAVSSLIPNTIVLVLIAVFMLFLNLGLVFWLGEVLGRIFYGFFVVAGFYGIAAIVVHLFLHHRIKKVAGDYFIKNVLK